MANAPSAAGSKASLPELTLRGIIIGGLITLIFTAANVYLGLKVGLTFATSIPAAVISMGVLRLLGGGSILENNIVQTGASAGSSIAAGVIFTIPALVIMGYWPDFKYWWVLGIATVLAGTATVDLSSGFSALPQNQRCATVCSCQGRHCAGCPNRRVVASNR